MTPLLERWEKDPYQPRIQLAWECLPAMKDGTLHAVDPHPLMQVEDWPVSLCGVALQAKGAIVSLDKICPACQAISKEKQAEYDAMVEDGEF